MYILQYKFNKKYLFFIKYIIAIKHLLLHLLIGQNNATVGITQFHVIYKYIYTSKRNIKKPISWLKSYFYHLGWFVVLFFFFI